MYDPNRYKSCFLFRVRGYEAMIIADFVIALEFLTRDIVLRISFFMRQQTVLMKLYSSPSMV